MAGVSPGFVCQVETGRSPIPLEYYKKVYEVLHLPAPEEVKILNFLLKEDKKKKPLTWGQYQRMSQESGKTTETN